MNNKHLVTALGHVGYSNGSLIQIFGIQIPNAPHHLNNGLFFRCPLIRFLLYLPLFEGVTFDGEGVTFDGEGVMFDGEGVELGRHVVERSPMHQMKVVLEADLKRLNLKQPCANFHIIVQDCFLIMLTHV